MAKRGIRPEIYIEPKKSHTTLIIVIIVVVVLVLFLIVLFSILASFKKAGANVAVINIDGTIMTGEGYDNAAYSDEIVSFIEDATENERIRAIIFDINSPGGGAVASQEIAEAIKKARASKLTVAYIRELGASGAYWVASSCDYIITSDMAVTGSIGVIGSYLEFSGLLERFNITYERLVGGKYKDIGSPYKNLTEEERDILQKVVDKIYNNFVQEVSRNRNISLEKTYELATGMFYLGSEAKELGLIDAIGGKEDVINYIEEKEGIEAKIYEYKSKSSLLSSLYGIQAQGAYWLGKGIGAALKEDLMSLPKT